MIQGLLDRQRIHLAAAIFAGFDGPLQIMSRNLDRHRVSNNFSRLPVVLYPRGMRESDPNRPVADYELYIDCIGVPRRDCHNQGLILAVQRLAGPLVDSLEIVVHNCRTIADRITFRQ